MATVQGRGIMMNFYVQAALRHIARRAFFFVFLVAQCAALIVGQALAARASQSIGLAVLCGLCFLPGIAWTWEKVRGTL